MFLESRMALKNQMFGCFTIERKKSKNESKAKLKYRGNDKKKRLKSRQMRRKMSCCWERSREK